ncbi:hypothetical protein [Lacinutrix sp. Bg11-31]|uniref:hypothetical protein n=1 Tax=Lacinutrix sp. Bg11-31 TaxID=2057808 RepID=UPI0012FDA97F|nr:hypothetical protein [Lacinutrix sp. Bg11-31]
MIYFGVGMIGGYKNWDNSFICSKQLISGIGLIVVALVFIVSNVLILIRNNRN